MLQRNLDLDGVNRQRAQLKADIAADQAKLASAKRTGNIVTGVSGLVEADPTATTIITLPALTCVGAVRARSSPIAGSARSSPSSPSSSPSCSRAPRGCRRCRRAALATKGASQQRETLTVPAGRGTIFDRSGVQLAIGEQATTVYANPREIVNPRAVANAAAQTLGVDAAALYQQLTDRTKWFVYVDREADPAEGRGAAGSVTSRASASIRSSGATTRSGRSDRS